MREIKFRAWDTEQKRFDIDNIKTPQLVGWNVPEARWSWVYETGEPMRNPGFKELHPDRIEIIGNIYESPKLLL
jgi:hypothetical protein